MIREGYDAMSVTYPLGPECSLCPYKEVKLYRRYGRCQICFGNSFELLILFNLFLDPLMITVIVL